LTGEWKCSTAAVASQLPRLENLGIFSGFPFCTPTSCLLNSKKSGVRIRHCCPVMRSPMIDYAFNGRDLRVEKDVSNLVGFPILGACVLWKNYFFASCRTGPSAAVPPVRGALSRQLQGQSVFVLGSVFVHDFCTTDLSREPTRYRGLSERALRSTLSLRLPQPCVSQHISRRQRSARLAHPPPSP
jgi:hypothetical protein